MHVNIILDIVSNLFPSAAYVCHTQKVVFWFVLFEHIQLCDFMIFDFCFGFYCFEWNRMI